MTLPASGPITFLQLQGEFGGSTPITMTEYYGADTGIPTSGQISMSQFYGKSAADPLTYLGSSNNVDNAAISLTGMGLQQGDLVIFYSAVSNDFGTNSIPSGYTTIASLTQGSTNRVKMAYKFMGASPDTSITSYGTGDDLIGAAMGFRGVNATPLDNSYTWAASTGANPTTPAITTVTAGTYVISFISCQEANGDTHQTAPSGYTKVVDRAVNTGLGCALCLAYRFESTSGSKNPGQWAGMLQPAVDGITTTLAIRPA
jgi:hypothetical protein